MKIFVTILLSLIITIDSVAQIEKGTWVAGSNLSLFANFGDSPSGKNRSFRVNIAPNFGYFVKKNLAIGGIISYAFSYDKFTPKTSMDFPQVSSQNNIVPAFFTKQYFVKNRFGGFVQGALAAGYNYISSEVTDPNLLVKRRDAHALNISLFLSVGITYFFNQNWAVELQYGRLGYNYYRTFETRNSNHQSSKNHQLLAGFTPDNLFVNIRYYFPPQKKKNG